MAQFKHIGAQQAWQQLHHSPSPPVLVDIRDAHAYAQGHPVGAINLTAQNITSWLQQTDFSQTVMVICYHGNSSQVMAQNLIAQGFADVYSIDGGFAAWVQYQLPIETVEH